MSKKKVLTALAKVDSIQVVESFNATGNSTWNHVTLCFQDKGHQYSTLKILTELPNIHTAFKAGKEYLITVTEKD